MKKITSIVVSIIIAFTCLGIVYADEGSIDQLLAAYENDNNEKTLQKLKHTSTNPIFKSLMTIKERYRLGVLPMVISSGRIRRPFFAP